MHCTELTTQRARKNYTCTWCGERIEASERYARYMVFNGYDTGPVKLHEECLAAALDSEEEFVPGANPRGYVNWP